MKTLTHRQRVLLVILAITAALWVLFGCGCTSTPGGKKLFVPVSTNELGKITYEVNPGITNALGIGREIGGQLPAPWGTVLTAALGVTSAVLGIVAKRKSDQAAVIPAMIAGVELSKNNQEVKTTIQRIATATGVEKKLNKLVHTTDAVETARNFGK